MKKIIYLVILSIVGISIILLLNVSIKSLSISGINLPLGWDGPYYWVTNETPNDHSSGVPFTMIKYSEDNIGLGAYYTSTLAFGLNIISGIGIGLGIGVVIQKLKKKTA